MLFATIVIGDDNTERLKLTNVDITGNSYFSDRQLRRSMTTRSSGLFKTYYYYPTALKEDISVIEMLHKDIGYLEAKVTDYNASIDSLERTAEVSITIDEGTLTKVEGVTIFGNENYPDSDLYKLLQIKPEDPLKRKSVENSTLALLSQYANRGYLEASVTPEIRVNRDNHTAVVDYFIKEGVQYRVNKISINGLQKTRQKVVKREVTFSETYIAGYSDMMKVQRKLYQTGLFKRVFIQSIIDPNIDSGYCDIEIDIVENLSREYNASIGFGSVEKARTRVELTNFNWKGTSQKLGINAGASFMRRNIDALFSEPWTFGTKWRTDISATYEYNEEPGYDYYSFSGKITLGRSFSEYFRMSGSYNHKDVTLDIVRVTPVPVDVRSDLRSLYLTVSYDTRDDLFNTTKGFYFEQSGDITGEFLKGTDSFIQSDTKARWYYSVTSSTVLASAIEVGAISSKGLEGIPLTERLYAGGPNSIRGFKYQHVGPIDENNLPIGGRVKVVWNVIELRQQVYKMIGMSVFMDAGNVWSSPEVSKLANMRLSPGASIRLSTPLGMARVGYAVNVDPKSTESGYQVYFSVGQAF